MHTCVSLYVSRGSKPELYIPFVCAQEERDEDDEDGRKRREKSCD